MNYLRKLVSGKRRRFVDQKYDLDITQITPRVLAMSFPSSGFESAYRNPITKVAQFLKENYGDKYHVFNCSERTYDKTLFNNQGSDFLWKDHHAPTLPLLFSMVKSMYEFLKKDPENVVIVHCNSGKGRTGTAIATLLVYTGFFDNMDEALKYYGWKRFSSGIGVSQPCQLRTIYYFEAAMKGVVNQPCAKKLKSIVFSSVPNISNDGCRPFFEILHPISDDLLYQWKQTEIRTYYQGVHTAILFDFEEGLEPIIMGDVHFLFKHKGVISDSLMFRIAFNAAFIPHNNSLIFKKHTVSPDKMSKDTRYPEDFILQMIFEDYCSCAYGNKKMEQYCERCKVVLKEHIASWRAIQMISEMRHGITAQDGNVMHFGTSQENETDKYDILQLKLQFESSHYKIQPKGDDTVQQDQAQHDREILQQQMIKIRQQQHIDEQKQQAFEGFDSEQIINDTPKQGASEAKEQSFEKVGNDDDYLSETGGNDNDYSEPPPVVIEHSELKQ